MRVSVQIKKLKAFSPGHHEQACLWVGGQAALHTRTRSSIKSMQRALNSKGSQVHHVEYVVVHAHSNTSGSAAHLNMR
jgi:hypothetical protein